jgi:putative methyltransferase (TIGR04325 family)
MGRKIRSLFGTDTKPKSNDGWFGDYKTWEEVERECGGYDSSEILNKVRTSVLKVRNGEAVYERDSVLFDEIQYSKDLIQSLKDSIKDERLHVVDFGGSLGSTYFQHKNIFKDLEDMRWAVVEQKHFVECGKKEIAVDHLRFYNSVEEALKTQSNHVLLLSSVIPYFKEPYELIKKMLSYNFENIIIDRTAFIEGQKERITKQIVPESIYKASYPAWFLNEKKFLNAFTSKYELVREFKSAFDPDGVQEDGVKVYRKGFYFKRRN